MCRSIAVAAIAFALLLVASTAEATTTANSAGGTTFTYGFSWLGPQPEPPDYPQSHAPRGYSRELQTGGYNWLGPQPEPPDYPVDDYELFLFEMFGRSGR